MEYNLDEYLENSYNQCLRMRAEGINELLISKMDSLFDKSLKSTNFSIKKKIDKLYRSIKSKSPYHLFAFSGKYLNYIRELIKSINVDLIETINECSLLVNDEIVFKKKNRTEVSLFLNEEFIFTIKESDIMKFFNGDDFRGKVRDEEYKNLLRIQSIIISNGIQPEIVIKNIREIYSSGIRIDHKIYTKENGDGIWKETGIILVWVRTVNKNLPEWTENFNQIDTIFGFNASYREIFQLNSSNSNIEDGYKIADPNELTETVEIKQKLLFANERTFLGWFQFNIFVGGLGAALLNLREERGKISGSILIFLALIFIGYSVYQYYNRYKKIVRGDKEGFEDKYGQYFLVIIFIISILFSSIFEIKQKQFIV